MRLHSMYLVSILQSLTQPKFGIVFFTFLATQQLYFVFFLVILKPSFIFTPVLNNIPYILLDCFTILRSLK